MLGWGYLFFMKLEKYMRENVLNDAQIAERIGVTKMAVYWYRRGRRFPRPEVMMKIVEITGGAVQPSDFYAAHSPKPSRAKGAA